MAIQHQPRALPRPKAYIFQPPATPSTAASTPYTNTSTTTRKRSRGDSECYFTTPSSTTFHGQQTPYSAGANGWSTISYDACRREVDAASPAPLVNERYRIRGGADTPTLTAMTRYEEQAQNESEYRRRWSVGGSFTLDEDSGQVSGHMNGVEQSNFDEKYGLEFSQNGASVYSTTWGQKIFSVAAGVAGVVFDFCRYSTAPFRGFQAGGGTTFSEKESELGSESIWQDAERSMSMSQSIYGSPMPGTWHAHDEDPDFSERPVKRGRTSQGSEWVIVESGARTTSTDSNMNLAYSNRPQSRHHSPTKDTPTYRSRATRPSTTPLQRPNSRRSIIPVRRNSTVSVNLSSGSPKQSHSRSHSYTRPPRGPPSPVRLNTSNKSQGQLSPDVVEYRARVAREEREQEASMRKMNRQLQQMIRQGRQALGTKIVIEDGGD